MRGFGFAWAMAVLTLCGMVATPGWAGVSLTGDTLDYNSTFYAGYHDNSTGSLTIDAGSVFDRPRDYLGYASGSTGTAIVAGAGSKWISSGVLFVGYSGSGKLTVSDGGVVSAKTLYASLSDLYGDGMITAQSGVVLDADLSFDVAHGLTQTLPFGSGGTLQFTIDGTGDLGVGYRRSGSLRIAEGRSVASANGYLGYGSGSTGTAIVSGGGSKWTNSSSLWIGYGGNGTLTVSDGGSVSTRMLYASLSDLYGDGTITVRSGGVLDADLVFDAAHGLTHVLAFGTGGILQFDVDGTGTLGVGCKQSGSLRIADGRSVTSTYGYLGYDSGSTGAATITGAGSKWTNSSALYVGYSGTGTLRVDAGGQVSSSLSGQLGFSSGSMGEAIITGGGSKWTNSGLLYVGNFGSGTLKVEAGGQVSSSYGYLGYYSGSTGTATITGAGSKWTNLNSLYVGHSGRGTVKVEAGGQVSSSYGYLGYYSGSTGEAIVTGAGSRWTNSYGLHVGYNHSSGTLTVSDGGVVNAKTLYASLSDLYGNGTITAQSGVALDADLVFDSTHGLTQTLLFGSGGILQFTVDGTGDLGVGYNGSGSLRIADGRSVTSSMGYLGYHSGSTGTATVSGAGSTWTNSSWLLVGRDGSGTLTVEAGAQVSSTNSYVGYNSGSSGKVTLTGAGSTWTSSGQLSIGGSGLVEQSGGTVHAGSAVIGGKGSYVLSKGVLEVAGSMTVRGGSVSWQGGQLSAASLTLDRGRMELLGGGEKVLKLASLSMVNGGTLDLADNAMIVQADAGTRGAVLQAIAGQIGAARNAEELWRGAGITSSVARDEGSGLYGLGAILNVDGQGQAIYSMFEGEAVDANSVLVKYTLNGDADLNGKLNASDYFFIDRGFLSRNSDHPLGGYQNGDFDYSGKIDASDYFLIDKAFLATRASGTATALNAVPEPMGLGVVAIMAGVGLVRRRRMRASAK